MTRILFICHGNICRSPMAEFNMKELVRREGAEQQFEIAAPEKLRGRSPGRTTTAMIC